MNFKTRYQALPLFVTLAKARVHSRSSIQMDAGLRRHDDYGTRGGFTLIELCIVLGLMATLLTISWPALKTAYGHYTVETSADDLRNAFERARTGSIVERCRYQVQLQPEVPGFVILREDVEHASW